MARLSFARACRHHSSRRAYAIVLQRSVHDVARDLIGCTVAHGPTAGVIVETESYHVDDPACHAFGGPTPRSSVLFGPPAHVYVYLSYGIHSLLNFVCEPEGEAAAVLIRALEPTEGIDEMRGRRGLDRVEDLCSGPGKLTQALGIGLDLNGVPLVGGPIHVLSRAGDTRSGDRHRAPHRHHEGGRASVALLCRRQPLRLPAMAALVTAILPAE